MSNESTNTSLSELAALLLTRLGGLWLLVLTAFLLPIDNALFFTFMGAALIVSIPYSLWLRDKLHTTQLASLLFLFDITVVTALVYFTGGAQSNLTVLYLLVILSAGLIGTPKQAVEVTVLSIITYVLMGTLLSNDILIEYVPSELLLQSRTSGFVLIARSLMFLAFGAASIYVSRRCSHTQGEEDALESTTMDIFRNLPFPCILLDQIGTIFFSNAAACALLGEGLLNKSQSNFSDLCIQDTGPLAELDGKTALLKRLNKSPLPVACFTEDIRLPEKALLGTKGHRLVSMNITMLALVDRSQQVEIEQQLKKVERITAATRIAGEMAHEIRTPLTAISASVQLLRRYEDKATSADWLPNSPRRQDRKELFNHIDEASSRMDDVVQNFVNFAEFSPTDLLSIIKLDSKPENKGYIGHLNTLGRDIKHGQDSDSGRRSDNTQLVE